MDEMRIESRFLKEQICNIIERNLKKKLGINVFLNLKELNVKIIDGETHISIAADAKTDKKTLTQILQAL